MFKKAFLWVPIIEYQAFIALTHSTIEQKLLFSIKHPAPCRLESPNVTLHTADSRNIVEGYFCLFKYLLVFSVFCVLICQLFQYVSIFSAAACTTLACNSDGFHNVNGVGLGLYFETFPGNTWRKRKQSSSFCLCSNTGLHSCS